MILTELTNSDKKYLSKINKLSEYFEEIIDKSLDYKINFKPGDIENIYGKVEVERDNKKTIHTYTVISMYNNITHEFIWNKQNRDRLKSLVIDMITYFNGNIDCINKLFNADSILLDKKYKSTIAYIVALIYKKNLNVIRFISGDIDIYIILDLNIPSNLTEQIISKYLLT